MSLQYLLSINGLVVGIISLLFGFIVLFKNVKNRNNQTLFLLTLTTAIWSFGYWRWLAVYDDGEQAIFWVRVLSIGSLFIPVFYFHWIVSLLGLESRKKHLITIIYFFAFFILVFSFTPFFISGVESNIFFAYWPKPGILYTIYLFLIYSTLVIYSIFLLFKKLKRSTGLRREQIKYVLYGSILGLGGGATNFFLWYDINIPPLGSFFVILYPIIFSYSIIKHRLMDIKFVLRKSSVFIVSIITIIILVIFVNFILSSLVPNAIDGVIYLVILILSLVSFPSIKKFYYRLANKYFFSSLYDSQEVIASMSEKLRSTLEVQEIYEFVYDSLVNAFHSKTFGILSYNQKLSSYLIQYNKGFQVKNKIKFPENKDLHKMFISKNEPIITEEIKKEYYNAKTKKTIDLLTKLNVEILAPLNVKNKTIGLVVLGPKETGDMYNEEDLQVLKTMGAFAAVSIDHALQYKKLLSFNTRLKREVEKATEEIRRANRELKKLDATKSEFISIASHQLRTPLTVIKGYVSMMIEGSFGELTVEEASSLNKIYESNERLIQLVENLLDISRIESGRLQFNFQDIQLEKLIDSIVEELSDSAKNKGLKLNYKKSSEPLPKAKIDEEKLRQVIMNLIDNAIKYTKKGRITVTLKEIGKRIQFCVSDSGMGFTKEDLAHLFKKFSRGKGVSVVHTEGTGLGLYVAKEMIKAHHGKIWAESEGRGKGAKFYFELPVE